MTITQQYSRVNFKKLVKDLADMYHDDIFNVIITELVANALDAGADRISIGWNQRNRVLTISDNGAGMDAETFEQYHDFAAELKTRGDGIGFAGIGAKISFNIAKSVTTETRHGGIPRSSYWEWQHDSILAWHHTSEDTLKSDGTQVKIALDPDRGLPKIDQKHIVGVLEQQYMPLLVKEFMDAYVAGGIYRSPIQFVVNRKNVSQRELSDVFAEWENSSVKAGSQDVGWGSVGIRHEPSPDDVAGVLVCTRGKVVKSELFGQSAGVLDNKLFGMVEVPELVQYLITNKSDFRSKQDRRFNQIFTSTQDALKEFLSRHGVAVIEPERNQLSGRLERELISMIEQLPELSGDAEIRRTKEKKEAKTESEPPAEDESTIEDKTETTEEKLPKEDRKPRKPRKRSIQVVFEEHPERDEIAWHDSGSVIINREHPVYKDRTHNNQARLVYCMFAIGTALGKEDEESGVDYVDKFMSTWGKT